MQLLESSPNPAYMQAFFEAADMLQADPGTDLWMYPRHSYQALDRDHFDPEFCIPLTEEETGITTAGPLGVIDSGQSGYRSFLYWRALDETDSKNTITINAGPNAKQNPADQLPGPFRSYSRVSFPDLLEKFGNIAHTEEEINGTAERITTWALSPAAEQHELGYSDISHYQYIVRLLIGRSIVLYGSENDGIAPSFAHLADVDRNTPSKAEMTVRTIESFLGKLTIGHAAPPLTREQLTAVTGQKAADAVEAFDRHNLISNRFWVDTGVLAGGSVSSPELLPLVAKKLTGPNAATLLEPHRDNPARTARSFMTKVLENYAQQADRNAHNAKVALNRTRLGTDSNVDLGEIVRLASAVNHRLQGTTTKQPSRNPSATGTPIAEAFSVLLDLTKSEDTATREKQRQQDAAYTKILSVLFENAR